MKTLFYSFGQEINLLAIVLRVICAIIVGFVIGIERERKNRPAGLRTHILVCIGATLIALIEEQMIYETATLADPSINVSIGRLTVGVVTGVGFIGAGTIMMSKSRIIGLTTAASLWCTACLGVVNGMGYSILAVAISIVVIVILEVMTISGKTSHRRIIEVEYTMPSKVDEKINELMKEKNIRIFESNIYSVTNDDSKHCVSSYTIIINNKDELKTLILDISDIEFVTSVKIKNMI